MSSYDDPRWYEHPESHDGYEPPPEPASPPSYPIPSQQPPPQATQSSLSNNWQPVPAAVAPRSPRPKRGLLGQVVVVGALVIIAFLAGWFGHQLYMSSFALNSQSQYYEGLFNQAWSIVDQNYVDRKAVNYKQMSYQAIQAMLAVLGDTGHTRFLTSQQVQIRKPAVERFVYRRWHLSPAGPKDERHHHYSAYPWFPCRQSGVKARRHHHCRERRQHEGQKYCRPERDD